MPDLSPADKQQLDYARQWIALIIDALRRDGIRNGVIYTALAEALAVQLVASVDDINRRAIFVNLFAELTLMDQAKPTNGGLH